VILHAGLIAQRVDGRWRGALIEGLSGAGKSDLALRSLSAGFRMVADDRVAVWRSGEGLYGRAPDALAGLLEIRALGVLPQPALPLAQIVLVVRLERPERYPEPETADLLDLPIPVLRLDPFEGSAPAKLGRALQAFDAAHKRRM
jgi:serine kinase of HPr protein (carbohydrate metabolism regulator)